MVGGFGIKLGQLQAKLDSAVSDITYIKGRIDGAPPKQVPPLTSLLTDPIDLFERIFTVAQVRPA
jgi:hypothetical protein